MDRLEWKKRIKENCEKAGVYQEYYDDVIDSLAGILEKKDNAEKLFIENGGDTVMAYTNKGGATNIVKHPALVVIMELNSQALAYWRELGLTPSGLKKLNAEVIKDKNENNLDKILSKLL